jgi:hypothetical protein
VRGQNDAIDPCETFKRLDLCVKVLTQGPRRLMPPKSVDFDPPPTERVLCPYRAGNYPSRITFLQSVEAPS